MDTHWILRTLCLIGAVGMGSCGPMEPVGPYLDGAVQILDGVAPDVASECVDGQKRCVDNAFEVCMSGAWYEVKECVETCDPVLGCPEDFPEDAESYIWIANTTEGTLSKVNTKTTVEVARYHTCPLGTLCDPSRTSVNLHGDAVVTNRGAAPSSVTKFAASIDNCIDRNNSENIETSSGPTDVLPWGEDECMIWHTDLPDAAQFPQGSHGARATAWDGAEDPDSGLGGMVWTGTCNFDMTGNVRIYKLNGDTGAIEDSLDVAGISCAYGGAMDGRGNFWILDWLTTFSPVIVRIDMATFETESVGINCGYGITADSQGRIWTGGMNMMGSPGSNCVDRYDPATGTLDSLTINNAEFLRGIAVGVGKSEGYVWAADTPGTVYQIDATDMAVVGSYSFGSGLEMIGAAVDYEGYVWTVSMAQNATFKYDPDTATHDTVTIGTGPYTYSDMTGVQLKSVIIVN